jgi:hypothetical protein
VSVVETPLDYSSINQAIGKVVISTEGAINGVVKKNNHIVGPPGGEGEVGKHLPLVSPDKTPTETTKR